MNKIQARKHIRAAFAKAQLEIKGNAASGSLYARGLSTEGYAGGYAEALSDVLMLFNDCIPRTRNYWSDMKEEEGSTQ